MMTAPFRKAAPRAADQLDAGSGEAPDRAGPRQRPASYLIRLDRFVLPMEIGVYPHERGRRQRVRISVEMEVAYPAGGIEDQITRIPSYDDLVQGLRRLSQAGHVNLVETLAERVLDLCFAHEAVRTATVDVEKLDVVEEAQSVGVRFRATR